MNKIFTFIFLIFLQNASFAQITEKRICGTSEYMHSLEQSHPDVYSQRQTIEQFTQQYIQNHKKDSRTLITIPVVVHVVYNLNVQNISDAQINSQILALNKDFRRLNPDFANTPGAFQPLGADCQIEFVLAKRNPNGDSSTGITRTYTATTSFSANNNVKNTATGGKSPWPAESYLNIWVCKLSGGLLGYGQFPGGPAATDGVVISYKAFGTTGAALPPFNKGRTATHEIGHWLNLYHIWGDDGGSCNGSDVVGDTPNQGAENTGVPVYPKISCNNAPFGDMFMNYMDYSDDIAMTMFTIGQKTRMEALFVAGGFRNSLLTSLGGIYPIPQVVCGIPGNINASYILTNSAYISWDILPNANSYQLAYRKLNDSLWITLAPANNYCQLNNLLPNTTYQYKVQSICANGSSPYSGTFNFTTLPVAINPCANNYEPNNSVADAFLLSNDVPNFAMIDNTLDEDYYRIEIPELWPNIKIALSNLPQDYDLYLYSNRGVLMNSSLTAGLNNEEIIYNSNFNGPATYYIRVKSNSGGFSNINCYSLLVSTSANPFKQTSLDPSELDKTPILYPNPATDFITAHVFYDLENEVVFNFYNSFGQKLITKNILVPSGNNDIRFETNELPNGIYLMEIVDQEGRKMQKFTVSR